MKQLFKLFLLFNIITITSCQKEVIKPKVELVDDAGEIEKTISIFGDWLLVGGKMYITYLDGGNKIVYNHFDQNKLISSLRYEGSIYDFEDIEINVTRWTFIAPPSIPNTGTFILNNNTSAPYGFHLTKSNMTIVEYGNGSQQLGGSSRPLVGYLNGVPNQVNFYLQETYGSIGGKNVKYFSVLTFEKQ